MPKGNIPTSQFKGYEAKLLAQEFDVNPECIPNYLRSYIIPSNKKIKQALITADDIKWYVDRLTYLHFGKYVFSRYNIINELRYDIDNEKYTKLEYIEFYGLNNYLEHWDNAPSTPYIVEKRYDTDLNNYTKQEFIDYYGNNYSEHWNNAPIELP